MSKRVFVIGTGFTRDVDGFHLFYDTHDTAARYSEDGGYRIAYAYSADGLKWIKPVVGAVEYAGSTANNLLDFTLGQSGSWNHVMMASCGVLRLSDRWRMWVAGYYRDAENALHSQMGYYESDDPFHWKPMGGQPVVPNGPDGSFDWGFTRVPCVIREKGVYRMYYTASDGRDNWFVGYAESTNGRRWNKPRLNVFDYNGSTDNNLVLAAEPVRGELRVAHPWVFRDGNVYRMYYSVSLEVGKYCIGEATSQDGLHWIKDSQTVILEGGPQESFDYWYAAIPKVVRDSDGYRMWYTGYNGGTASAEGAAAYALGYATSPDGLHWHKCETNPIFKGD